MVSAKRTSSEATGRNFWSSGIKFVTAVPENVRPCVVAHLTYRVERKRTWRFPSASARARSGTAASALAAAASAAVAQPPHPLLSLSYLHIVPLCRCRRRRCRQRQRIPRSHPCRQQPQLAHDQGRQPSAWKSHLPSMARIRPSTYTNAPKFAKKDRR